MLVPKQKGRLGHSPEGTLLSWKEGLGSESWALQGRVSVVSEAEKKQRTAAGSHLHHSMKIHQVFQHLQLRSLL